MLLDKCDEIIEASEYPFQRFNLRTQKVFNDLVQFSQDPLSSMVRQTQSIDSVRDRGEKSSSLLKPKKSMANPSSKGFGVSGVKEKYVNSRHVSVG